MRLRFNNLSVYVLRVIWICSLLGMKSDDDVLSCCSRTVKFATFENRSAPQGVMFSGFAFGIIFIEDLRKNELNLTYHTSSLQVAVLQRKNPDWDRIESSQDFRPSGYATEGGLQRWQQMFARRCSGIGNRKGLVYRFQVSQFQIRRVANEIHSKSLSRWAKHALHLLSLSTMNL